MKIKIHQNSMCPNEADKVMYVAMFMIELEEQKVEERKLIQIIEGKLNGEFVPHEAGTNRCSYGLHFTTSLGIIEVHADIWFPLEAWSKSEKALEKLVSYY